MCNSVCIGILKLKEDKDDNKMIIKKIKIFPGGAICIEMNKPIETEEEQKEFDDEVEHAWKTTKW